MGFARGVFYWKGGWMRVIRAINNNVAICLDSNNREVVAFGKGIGFRRPPYEISLSEIDRTYADISPVYISMINEISEDVLECSMKIYDLIITSLDCVVNANIVITLADHIQFAIKRHQSGMKIDMPFLLEVQAYYKKEIAIAEKALEIIKRITKVELPREELSAIALHIVNAEAIQENDKDFKEEDVLDEICEVIEKELDIKIDKQGFNYSRFATHILYLLKRIREPDKGYTNGMSLDILKQLQEKSPNTYICAKKVAAYIESSLDTRINDEELMYILIHINRLYNREDCNQ